jgi:cell division septation protein DedD
VIKKRSDRKAALFPGSSPRERKNGKYMLLQGKRDRKSLTTRLREGLRKIGGLLSTSREERGSSSRRSPAAVEPVQGKSESQGATALVFAVIGLFVSATVMGLFTLRLADQPVSSPRSARLGNGLSDDASRGDDPWRRPSESAGKPTGETPAPVTFYNDLTAQEDADTNGCPAPTDASAGAPERPGAAIKAVRPADAEPQESKRNGAAARSGQNGRKSLTRTGSTDDSGRTKPSPAACPAAHARKFSVQVGTFAHPSVAREWAGRWKERGYDVILKPVARPGAGVIYRLYLGSFDAEKEADELIRQLKIKEGVNAFRVALI